MLIQPPKQAAQTSRHCCYRQRDPHSRDPLRFRCQNQTQTHSFLCLRPPLPFHRHQHQRRRRRRRRYRHRHHQPRPPRQTKKLLLRFDFSVAEISVESAACFFSRPLL